MQTISKQICFIVIALLVGYHTTDQSQCGVRQVGHTETIVRGDETAAGDWPWHAAVFHKDGPSDVYVCGGTLISGLFIVTAQHCVTAENKRQMLPENVFVRLGLHVRRSIGKNVQQHEISRIMRYVGASVHEERRDDIALLKLNTVAEMTPYVHPACVNEEENIAGRIGTVIGWGFTENDKLSEKLRSARLQIKTTDECLEANREVFGQTLHSGLFCAGVTNGTSACNGDSGGGIFLLRNNAWYLAGVVSFTEKREYRNICKPTGYTAFTRISKYSSWIQNNADLQLSGMQLKASLFPSDCGVYIENRIVRGQKAKLFEFPWMAIFYTTRNNSKDYNLGTLINKHYVLTTAWAVDEINIYDVSVVLGEHTLHQMKDCNPNDASDCAPRIEQYAINSKDIIIHENYDRHSGHNDIALIRLGRQVVFKDHIKPICLPTTPALSQLNLPQYIVAGWGKNEHGNDHHELRKATIRAVDYNVCRATWVDWSYKFSGQEFCAGGNAYGADLCNDRAAPIGYMAQHDAGLRFVQFGIWTWGPAACGELPSVYLRLANYVGWIAMNMKP